MSNMLVSKDAVMSVLSRHLENPESVWREILVDSTDLKDLKYFNQQLKMVRTRLKHRKIVSAMKDMYRKTLVGVVADATEFCEDFGLKKKKGYRMYIEYGIKLMGRDYRLNRFHYLKSKIYEQYTSDTAIYADPNEELTDKLFLYYQEKAGVPCEFSKHFVYTTEVILDNDFDYKDHIDAQIQILKNQFDSFPEPNQLHTDNAVKRTRSLMKGKDNKPKSKFSKLIE